MVKKIISVILIFCLLCAIPFSASAFEPTGIEVPAKSAMLVSLDTGEVLFSKNENEKVYPAALTLIMTALVVLESEKYNPEADIAMSEEALEMILGAGTPVTHLKAGEAVKQKDLVYMLVMTSFGDAALLAATHFGGSVDGFVELMNQKAKELGMTSTKYQNPIGLHDVDHYTTAADMRILTEYALKNQTFKEACETHRYSITTSLSNTKTISTTNALQDNTTNFFYTYAKGVKTGFTDEAGRCLISGASYNGYNYLCILLGCEDSPKRLEFTQSKELFRWAFNNFEFKEVADTDNPVAEVKVELSMETDFVSLYVEESFISVLPKDADHSTITVRPHPIAESVDAPIKKGDVLGTADIIYAENVIGTVNLVSHEDISSNAFLSVWRGITRFFTSSYMKVVYLIVAIAVIAFIIAVVRMNKGRTRKRKVKYVPYSKHSDDSRRR